LNTTAQTQAFQQQALALLTQRRSQIQYLQGQINATNDPKSIGELQARLQVEAAQVNNDTNRLSIMNAMAVSAERASEQALKERELHNLSLTSDGTDTFVYKPFSGR
jgi:type IV secretion system protein VirB5